MTKQMINVTRDGISTNDIVDQIYSERGKQAVFQALVFGATQSLMSRAVAAHKMHTVLGQMKEMGRTLEATTLEASNRYLTAQEAAHAAARKLVYLSTYSPETVIEFEPTIQRGSSNEQLKQKATFAGVSEQHVKDIEVKSALRKYEQVKNAAQFAEFLFYSIDIQETATELDADGYEYETTATHAVVVRPDHVLKSLQRARDWMLSWNNPDWAELGILKADIEAMEDAASRYETLQENSTDHQFDEGGATSADLAAGNGVS